MYGNQNNAARIFQIHREVASLHQEGKPFVQLLGSLKGLWNELEIYRPHTTDAAILQKRTEEDRIFQLLASLSPDFEDLRSHILMNPELPSLKSVCATIQREEIRRKVMTRDVGVSETRAYQTKLMPQDMNSGSFDHGQHRPLSDSKNYKGKQIDLKCNYCHNLGHNADRCWLLHPEIKPKFAKDLRRPPRRTNNYKSYLANNHANSTESFSATSATLISDFANYLHGKHGQGKSHDESTSQDQKQPSALLSHFADFLAEADPKNSQGNLIAFMTALELVNLHDLWIIDSGATDHMSNKLDNIHDFKSFVKPTFVSVADGKGAYVKGKGKINLLSDKIVSDVLFVPSFPFQLLSVSKITSTLNCEVILTSSKVVFQDLVTKEMIGEGFFLHGLYYISQKPQVSKGFQATTNPPHEHLLWHHRLAHPSDSVLSKIKSVQVHESLTCDICHFSKSTRLPFTPSMSKSTHTFELVHSDVWGPFHTSIDGFKYLLHLSMISLGLLGCIC